MLLVHTLPGNIRMEITCDDGQRIDVLVDNADIFLGFRTHELLRFGQIQPRVPFVEEGDTLRFHNAHLDIAPLLHTLECIAKCSHAFIAMGQELASQITGAHGVRAYTGDDYCIHVERLGVQAVYVKMDGNTLTVFMFEHFVPFIKEGVFVYGDDRFPGVEYEEEGDDYSISFEFPVEEAQVRRLLQVAARMLEIE